MEGMDIQGYLIDVTLDDAALRVHGRNKAARVALAGREHEGDVVIPRHDIAAVKNTRATLMTNGNLKVTTIEGQRYQLHYRKKSQADFDALETQLQVMTPETSTNQRARSDASS